MTYLDHLLGNKLGSRLAGNERGGDDDVNISGLLEEQVVLCLLERVRHLLSITTLPASVLNNALNGNVLTAERLNLLASFWSHVKAAHNGAHVFGRADGRETSHTSTDNENLGRRYLAGSGDLRDDVSYGEMCIYVEVESIIYMYIYRFWGARRCTRLMWN